MLLSEAEPTPNASDPYLIPGTECLANKLGIADPKQLNEVEAKRAAIREAQLGRVAFRNTFDLAHVRFLHRWLFQDVYPWAGAIRSIPMHKGRTEFARPEYIEDYAARLFESLKSESRLSSVPFSDLPSRVAFYFGELNALHPFREGNGRTQRLFLRQVLQPRRIDLAWDRVTPEENIAVSVAAFHGNEVPARELFARIMEEF